MQVRVEGPSNPLLRDSQSLQGTSDSRSEREDYSRIEGEGGIVLDNPISIYPEPQIGYWEAECCLEDLHQIKDEEYLQYIIERIASHREDGSDLAIFTTLEEAILALADPHDANDLKIMIDKFHVTFDETGKRIVKTMEEFDSSPWGMNKKTIEKLEPLIQQLDGPVFEKPISLKEYDRPYLLEQFPNYDYKFPKEPWKMDYRNPENRILVAWQIQAFHYYWAIKQTVNSGRYGYSVLTPYLPHLIDISLRDLGNTHLETRGANIIICSSALPIFPCIKENKKCHDWMCAYYLIGKCRQLIDKDGVIAGIGIDEAYANQAGVTLAGEGEFIHSWTANNFLKALKSLEEDGQIAIEEYDTLKNHFAYNFILRKL